MAPEKRRDLGKVFRALFDTPQYPKVILMIRLNGNNSKRRGKDFYKKRRVDFLNCSPEGVARRVH